MEIKTSNNTASKTAWLTLDREEFEIFLQYLAPQCEDWENPGTGEFRIVNPSPYFYTLAPLLGIDVY